jgi:hypothetical protein
MTDPNILQMSSSICFDDPGHVTDLETLKRISFLYPLHHARRVSVARHMSTFLGRMIARELFGYFKSDVAVLHGKVAPCQSFLCHTMIPDSL